jgi:hypothetical protein
MQTRLRNIPHRFTELGDDRLLCFVNDVEAIHADKKRGNDNDKDNGCFHYLAPPSNALRKGSRGSAPAFLASIT